MAAPQPKFSELYSTLNAWDSPTPDCVPLNNSFGGANAADMTTVKDAIMALSARSPTLLAFVLSNDEDAIYVGHSPSIYPADHASPAADIDNRVMVIVGDSPDASFPVILPNDSFARVNATRCHTADHLVGPNGHGHAPPVCRTGPHALGDPDVSEIRSRRALLLPAEDADEYLTMEPAGRYTRSGFWNAFLAAPHASADPAVTAVWAPVIEWFRLSSTNNAAGDCILRIVPAAPPPAHIAPTQQWFNKIKTDQLARIGHGGPGLTNAAFATGIRDVSKTLEATHQAALKYDQDKSNKTFEDKHGAALAQVLHRYCSVHTLSLIHISEPTRLQV